ncbi:MAG: N-6 DNA methylase [Armatimonadetes bacterium]|nr:N-6 DNA methylase [Armatimonadota bacterium]
MPGVTEWTLTADIAKWMLDIIHERPDLPFSDAKVEERAKGSRKRRDLTLYDRNGAKVITGEVKMPDSPEGRSPFQEALVQDAHDKADMEGVEYFFTWNVNRCVLWRTFAQGTPIADRHLQHWYVIPTPIRRSDELIHPLVEQRIKQFLSEFLTRCALVMLGAEPLPTIPLDEKFLLVWESSLEQPVAQTLRALSDRYEKDREFTQALDKWMRDEQTWVISHRDEEVVRENLERAAKFSCYVLANKVVFYKALRRRFTRMRALRIPGTVATGAGLQSLLAEHFEHAAAVSSDYETVFYGDYGDTLPFLSDEAVDSWRDLVRQTDPFDFTQLNYEIIGQVFERMLSTDERHKFGQHYTRSEVVDLINAFCIREPNAKVMDPACGGGTFLVRAYSRKRDLSKGRLTHQELIQQLYGMDISAYPAHLTTINLATRDLIDEANYPLVARKDFFSVDVGEPIFHVPLGSESKQIVALQIDKVDAVVGNPPYVRQEKITEYYGKKYKDTLRAQAQREAPGADLSGRSDIHCYFFTHGASFLNEGGYIGLLTSSTWLDTSYGFRLQDFLLNNFEIIAIFESNCEPWFTGARVTTAAVILRKQSDPEKRSSNTVKFALLTRPLSELLAYAPGEDDRRLTFEALRQRIEGMSGKEKFAIRLGDTESITIKQESLHGIRVRAVNQGDLHRLGYGAVPVSEEDEEDEGESTNGNGANMSNGLQDEISSGHSSGASGYIGYKWGIFLRAPDIFFKLLKRGGDRFVPLGGIAEVKFGVKSGCDAFFFPRDVTEEALSRVPDRAEFKERYGISRHATDRIRIVRAGDGSPHLIEKEFLEPVVFNPMEIDTVDINPARLGRSILLVDKPKEHLKGTYALKYIKWGEKEGFNERSTCVSRERWYSLYAPIRGDVLWSMTQRYRSVIPFNGRRFICNKRLFNIRIEDQTMDRLLCATLNSTPVALSRYCFGRIQGGDPVIETEVVDVKMMLVPDPRRATPSVRNRLENALDSLRHRKIGHLVNVDAEGDELTGELAMPDRQELDDAVLELLGISDADERKALRTELYAEMTAMYRSIRTAEKRMQKFRSQTARRGRPSARSIASEIWESMSEKPRNLTPIDFAPKDDVEEIDIPEGKARAANADLWNPCGLVIAGKRIDLGHVSRVNFAKALSDAGLHGMIFIPNDPAVSQRALDDYERYLNGLSEEFATQAAAHTADDQMQERIVNELWRLTRNAPPNLL